MSIHTMELLSSINVGVSWQSSPPASGLRAGWVCVLGCRNYQNPRRQKNRSQKFTSLTNQRCLDLHASASLESLCILLHVDRGVRARVPLCVGDSRTTQLLIAIRIMMNMAIRIKVMTFTFILRYQEQEEEQQQMKTIFMVGITTLTV